MTNRTFAECWVVGGGSGVVKRSVVLSLLFVSSFVFICAVLIILYWTVVYYGTYMYEFSWRW